MRDVWGRELVSGDLVLILNQTMYGLFIDRVNDKPIPYYGIVVSDKSVYTLYGLKHYQYLYKIEVPNEYEKLQHGMLIKKYNEEYVAKKNKKKSKSNIKIGDILDIGSYYDYLYLGKCRIKDVNLNDSSDIKEYVGYLYISINSDFKNQKNIVLNDSTYTEIFESFFGWLEDGLRYSDIYSIYDSGLPIYKCSSFKSKFLQSKSSSITEVVGHMNVIPDIYSSKIMRFLDNNIGLDIRRQYSIEILGKE